MGKLIDVISMEGKMDDLRDLPREDDNFQPDLIYIQFTQCNVFKEK